MAELHAVVAQSSVDAGADKCLRMLYVQRGLPSILYRSMPRWSGRSVDLGLSPK